MNNKSQQVWYKLKKLQKFYLLALLFLFCLIRVSASPIPPEPTIIKGVVVEKETGETLPGVNVIVDGTKNGTITDINGNFILKLPSEKAILKFSYIGYITQEVRITNQTVLKIALLPDAKTIDEVVVIGFGSQKKVNVTGAVSTLEPKKLVSASVANITTALIGNAPGVTGLQASGEAGRNATSIFIRGRSTFNAGGSDPLIVIDGVEQASEQAYSQLNSMDPNEIAAVSILKDASSTAVYGIRGANGVIIVTTKRGLVGKPKINFSVNYGNTRPTNLAHTANSYDWAVMRNEAIAFNRDQLGDPSFNQNIFTADDLWKYKNGRDYTPAEVDAMIQLTDAQKASLKNASPIWYGSHDFMEEQFNNNGPQKQVNLSLSGGTEKLKYFTSIGYFNQGSILGGTTYKDVNTGSTFDRYNFRSSFEFHPTKNLDISILTAGQFGVTSGAAGNTSTTDQTARYKVMMINIQEGNPGIVPYLIDGHLVNAWGGAAGSASNPLGTKIGTNNNYNPILQLLVSGQGLIYNTLLSNTIKVVHRLDYIAKGLSIRGTLNYDDNYTKTVTINRSLPTFTVSRDLADPNKLLFYGGGQGATALNTSSNAGSWNKTYYDLGIDYVNKIGDHQFTLLALGKASIYKLPTEGGYNTPSGIMGFVGRATYNYKDKYLAEYSMGYNGTEQFAKGRRFGFFPAYSLGWVISNEKFFNKPKWIDLIKVRGSYGKVGSDYLNKSRYLFLPSSYIGASGYYFGSSSTTANPSFKAVKEGAVGNPLVTWEQSTKSGVGLDTRFFADRLNFTLDLFKEDRDNILWRSSIIPGTYGVDPSYIPPVNVGVTTNHGYEITLGWNDKIGKVGYNISGALSYARNKVVYRAEASNPYPWMNITGLSIGQYRGLKSDGFFNTPEELANRPYNSYSANKQVLGDIRYKDMNGDGIINDKDMVPIGYNNLPEYSFNFKLGLDYRGFDISTLFIGAMHGSYYLQSNYTSMYFKTGGMAYQWQVDGRWTPEKVANGTEITYPRPQVDFSATPNFTTSDFWLKSTDFLRLKNLEVGYTLPTKILKSVNISSLRIYANGNNLWTSKSELDKYGIDPEAADQSGANVFPLTRALLMGLSVSF